MYDIDGVTDAPVLNAGTNITIDDPDDFDFDGYHFDDGWTARADADAVVILVAGAVYATATNYIVPTLVVPFEAAATAAIMGCGTSLRILAAGNSSACASVSITRAARTWWLTMC